MHKKIAIFDSGVGGLTVFREIHARLPYDSLIYVGDTARVPYGYRSPEVICQYSREILFHLLNMPLSAIVVACHSASSVAVPTLKKLLDDQRIETPLFDVLSFGVKNAVETIPDGPIGIIGTETTISSGRYRNEILKARPDMEIIDIACPLFVPLVEEGMISGAVPELVVAKYLKPLVGRVNAVILACTHYPLLRELIGRFLGPDVTLLDPAEAVADAVEDYIPPLKDGTAEHIFQVTDNPERFYRIARHFLGKEITMPERITVSAPVVYSRDAKLPSNQAGESFSSLPAK